MRLIESCWEYVRLRKDGHWQSQIPEHLVELLQETPKTFSDWEDYLSPAVSRQLSMRSAWYEERTPEDVFVRFMLGDKRFKNLLNAIEEQLEELNSPQNPDYIKWQNNMIIFLWYYAKIFNSYVLHFLQQNWTEFLDKKYVDYIQFVSKMYERKIAENYLRKQPIRILNQYPRVCRWSLKIKSLLFSLYEYETLNANKKFRQDLYQYLTGLPEVSEIVWTSQSGSLWTDRTDGVGFVVEFEDGPQPQEKPKYYLQQILAALGELKKEDWTIGSDKLYIKIQELRNFFIEQCINPWSQEQHDKITTQRLVHNFAFFGWQKENADPISWHVLNVLEQLAYDHKQIDDANLIIDYVKKFVELVEKWLADSYRIWSYDVRLLQDMKFWENTFFPRSNENYNKIF